MSRKSANATRLLALCLLGVAVWGEGRAEPARLLTFIEARTDTVDRCRMILRQYEKALAQPAQSQRIHLLEEIGQAERFVLLETAQSAAELARAEDVATSTLTPLNDLLAAPPDRREHRVFGDTPPAPASASAASSSASAAAAAAAANASTDVYIVIHVDIGPPNQAKGEEALLRLATEARRADGNLRFDVWRQVTRPNHFNIVSTWRSRGKFDGFAAGSAMREFRGIVAPLIGSPYDERFYRLVE